MHVYYYIKHGLVLSWQKSGKESEGGTISEMGRDIRLVRTESSGWAKKAAKVRGKGRRKAFRTIYRTK